MSPRPVVARRALCDARDEREPLRLDKPVEHEIATANALMPGAGLRSRGAIAHARRLWPAGGRLGVTRRREVVRGRDDQVARGRDRAERKHR
jgi:hypothetical protein